MSIPNTIGIAAKQRVYIIRNGKSGEKNMSDMLKLLMFHVQMTIYPLRKSY
jgi:hypothetical protein